MATASASVEAVPVTIPRSPRGYSLRPEELYIPVEDYLRTTYHPDMDYVDGHLEERNMGEVDHSQMQAALLHIFLQNQRSWNIRVLPECRLQIKPNRFRIPDIMVIARDEKPDRVVRKAPLLCIEVLSPEDTHKRILYRVDDYVEMGVKNVWVLDPEDGRVFTHAGDERRWTDDHILTVAGTLIQIDLDQIAAELAD